MEALAHLVTSTSAEARLVGRLSSLTTGWEASILSLLSLLLFFFLFFVVSFELMRLRSGSPGNMTGDTYLYNRER